MSRTVSIIFLVSLLATAAPGQDITPWTDWPVVTVAEDAVVNLTSGVGDPGAYDAFIYSWLAIDDADTENNVVQTIGTAARTATTLASAASAGDSTLKVASVTNIVARTLAPYWMYLRTTSGAIGSSGRVARTRLTA